MNLLTAKHFCSISKASSEKEQQFGVVYQKTFTYVCILKF